MKISIVQTDLELGNPAKNGAHAVEVIRSLEGVELVIFPEAYLTGYAISTLTDAKGIAISLDHPVWADLQSVVEETKRAVIIGYAGLEGETIYNGAALLRPGQSIAIYRKTHLPWLGLDKFVTPGEAFPVFEVGDAKIGILICYDLRPPEATRVLALKGIDLLVLPTNWPVGAETSAEHLAIARAIENRIFVATCNRVGTEGGFEFIGRSKIIDPAGRVLGSAGSGPLSDEIVTADLDLAQSRQKRLILIPDSYEIDVMSCRRADLYGDLGTSVS